MNDEQPNDAVVTEAGGAQAEPESTEHWDEMVSKVETKEFKGWLDYEFIECEYIRPQVSGDPDVYYLKHFIDRNLSNLPVERALSLGCGGGNLERFFVQENIVQTIDANDASPGSIEFAERMADEAGLGDRIRYEVADANKVELETGVYDFVVAKMSLHHFDGLEHIYDQVARSLKPDGVFMFNEFVGPSKYQWTDLQLELMNQILEALPSDLREGAPAYLSRPTIEQMDAVDPTEAIRSAEIMPVLERWFQVVEYRPYGGTLLQILLAHVMANFDLERPEHKAMLRLIFLLEKSLVDHRVLASDFAYVIAKPLPRGDDDSV